MKQNNYISPEIEIIEFKSDDIITASLPGSSNDTVNLPHMPI